MIIFKIEDAEGTQIHVEMSAANLIEFDLDWGSIERYSEAIQDVCQVAPHMMSLDSDLQEAYDDAFRTRPKQEDQMAVRAFLNKYKGRVPDYLGETFFT